MTLLVIADTDEIDESVLLEPADLLISCGDLDDAFINRVALLNGVSQVMGVKGNHDSSGGFAAPMIDLHLKMVEWEGVRFGGFAGSWRYKPRGHYLWEQAEVAEMMADFPAVDVFVAHNSPRGIHDKEDGVHFGFEAFGKYIERSKPGLFLHGHQHVNRVTRVKETEVIGVYGARRVRVEL